MKIIHGILLVALLVALACGCVYAFDNDPTFQLSQTYTGR